MAIDFLNELQWRGLLHQCTDEQALRAHLADPANNPRKAYAGFDPTSDSLTIGNLVPIMVMVHFARAGHTPIILMGGGTGLIGDPSGKSAERQLMTEETVRSYVEAQRPIYENVFQGAAVSEGRELAKPTIVNNLDWLSELGFIEVLRDVGKHFSVNMMMQKESVKARLEEREHGISYTEFSYMILQSYDFLHLYRESQVTVQVGGSDQYGNITAGCDLIGRDSLVVWIRLIFSRDNMLAQLDRTRFSNTEIENDRRVSEAAKIANASEPERVAASAELIQSVKDTRHTLEQAQPGEHTYSLVEEALADAARYSLRDFGLTAPLITKADGGKFGKTESGAIWLTANRTSPYAYHQFWLNASDEDVVRYLKIFTLLTENEIDRLANEVETNPGAREAQKTLAHHATSLLHGEDEAIACEQAAKALFSGEIADLPEATLRAVLGEVPSSDHPKADLAGDGLALLDLLIETELASSKRQAREFLAAGSISINGRKVEGETSLTAADLLHGSMIAIRRGKKAWHLTRWS